MYILRPNEKTAPVMLYAQQSVIRGEAVIKQNVQRVNIWLRTDGAPRYVHILKPQVLVFGGSPVKALSYSEVYFPSSQAIAFHPLPPTDEPLDYDSSEADRKMEDVDLLVGTFVMKGKFRISTHMEVNTSLEAAGVSWLSVYDVSITNPYLPQMPAMQIPMVLVNPGHVAFGLA
ncbi:MAG TPA: hypothetical protein VMN99_11820 [Anaerolineales bacterium]|nr:hypothetical protein [Anaerolineales bacterium]